MDPEERRCEACRMRAVDDVIESDEPNQPYQLCSACAHRLQTLSLRPREWFHLAALHGSRKFLLHDDFYSEDGTALVPKEAEASAHCLLVEEGFQRVVDVLNILPLKDPVGEPPTGS